MAAGLVLVLTVLLVLSRFGNNSVEATMATLRGRGEKLTFEELAIPYLTNGAPHTKAINDAVHSGSPNPDGLGSIPLMKSVAPGQAVPLVRGRELPPTTWEVNEQQMRALDAPLEALRTHTETVELDFGYPAADAINRTHPFVEKRTAAQLLSMDVIRQLHGGKLPTAHADLHALAQLAHFHERAPLLVNAMINAAILGLYVPTLWEALQVDGWTDQQLAAWQKDLASFDVPASVAYAFAGERAVGLMFFKPARMKTMTRGLFGVTSGSWRDVALSVVTVPFYSTLWSASDQLLYLQHSQSRLEAMRALASGQPFPAVLSRFKEANQHYERVLNSWRVATHRLCALTHIGTEKVMSTTARLETLRRLGLTAVALARYRLANGKVPATLEELVPRYLPEVPRDPFDARPLRYRALPDGTYKLWSIGSDGKDNLGDARPPNALGAPANIEQGQDWVWPIAVDPKPE